MNNTSGTLDPSLYLIGPQGNQVAANDDAVAGENTNSLISNLTLPADGQYIIIATHFGARYGGTTGTYSLTLTKLELTKCWSSLLFRRLLRYNQPTCCHHYESVLLYEASFDIAGRNCPGVVICRLFPATSSAR